MFRLVFTTLCIFLSTCLPIFAPAGNLQESKAQLDAALMKAAEQDNAGEIKALLGKGASPHAKGKLGWTPFMFVSLQNDVVSMRLLLRAGADINATSADSDTPLMNASMLGRSRAVRTLLSMGAKVNTANKEGNTALSNAAIFSDDIVEMLIKHGANVNKQDSFGLTALISASAFPHGTTQQDQQYYIRRLRVVRLLLNHKADPNKQSNKGYTALMAASSHGNVEMVLELLKHGANVGAIDRTGRSALEYAVARHQNEVVKLLTRQPKPRLHK